MSAARIPLTFRVFRGAELVREQTLTQSVIKLGKVSSAHLQLDDESVSRMHAILEVDHAGAVNVIDLGSTRGTFVNGTKINKARLESGDVLQLGNLRVEVTIGVRAADVQPAVMVRDADIETSAVRPPAAAPATVRPPAMPVRAPATPVAAVRPPATAPMFGSPMSDDELVGATAIEVAAMLGDSVVGVKHCMDPKSGKISPKTWAMFAAGLAFLLTSAIAFYVSVSTAAFNKGALEYWTRVAHKPAYSFRPQVLSLGYDWLAFGGLALGLVAVAAGLLRMRDEKRTPFYRIGTAPGVELPLQGAPSASFPLVAPALAGDDFVFNYGAGIDGELTVDGKTTTFAELAATGRARPSPTTFGAIEIPIPARARIRARSGQTTFVVSAVAQPRRHATPLLAGLESRAMAYFAGSLAVHLGVWALLQQIPQDGGAAEVDLGDTELASIHSTSIDNETVPPPVDPLDGSSGDHSASANSMAIDPGAAGKPNAVAVDGHLRMKNNDKPPQLTRQQAIEEARTAGFMGEASPLRGGFASLLAVNDVSSGLDSTDVWGPLYGAEGEGRGNFGYARSGFGAGGDCKVEPCGIIGVGGYGLIGRGPGTGYGYDGGLGHGRNLHGHPPAVPPVHIGEGHGTGDYDKGIIRRYIQRNIDKISYCYEHELLARPEMAGEIQVQFFILPTGTVKSSTGKGFDATVANCVADVVSHIEFPAPGGPVEVNYPFTFHAAGK